MGQIVKRKKKGRPSKADLARRSSGQTPTRSTPPERRRSLRRRNVRYNNFIDYDDYLDDFEDFQDIIEENDEQHQHHEQKRREKKLKLVVKLHNEEDNNKTRPKARVLHARRDATSEEEDEEEEDDDDDDESERKPLKKRRVNHGDGGGGDESEEEEEEREGESENESIKEEDNDQEERSEGERNTDVKGKELASGTQTERGNGPPLPDKKLLELILSKLQKRDTYGVYAEPVDLEELPDYLDVIDHPMDFATVRKKLGNGSYSTLEEFESDVFLICSNAMQYNGPETIYHKQARAIQELAKKKFQKIRIDIERSESEVKSEQRTKTNFSAKKPMKRPLNRNLQEPIGSDYSSAATLAAAGEAQNVARGGGCERHVNSDALLEGSFYAVDNNLERAEDSISGKGLLSKFGRKLSVVDENRRATYNVSSQPEVKSESIFSTFEGEVKQLVAVGLHAECSYARSLARFAATLGPVAWKVASKRIEQALPNGCKFGRGWVGEYEPPPTPVLLLEKRMQNESMLLPTFTDPQKSEASPRNRVSAKEQSRFLSFEGKPPLFRPTSVPVSEEKSSFFPSPRTNSSPANPVSHQQDPPKSFASANQQQKPRSKSSEVQNKVSKQVELNLPPSSCQQDVDVIAGKKGQTNSDMATPKCMEKPGAADVKQSQPPKMLVNSVVDFGGLPNGKASNNLLNSRVNSPSSGSSPHQMTRGPAFFPQGQDKRLTDPVEAMRMSAEKSHKVQVPSNQSSGVTAVTKAPAPSVRNDSGNASVAAAHAWMSIGSGGFRPPVEIISQSKGQISAESLYNPARPIHAQFPPFQGQFPRPAGFQFQPDMHNFPFQAFARPVHSGNGQVQNLPMVFPQLVSTDMSRLQMQSPWQAMGIHSQLKQKQENLPPDLNIGCQSPGSPVKQSSGEMVDSQQPDLALQL